MAELSDLGKQQREELIDDIHEVMSDTCDMDVGFTQYATAVVEMLEKRGLVRFDTPDPRDALGVQQRAESVVAAENRGLREEIVKAQSNCTAWLNVFETIEAHIRDRMAMDDPANPERYLRIIQADIGDVAKEARAIENARWQDGIRYQTTINRHSTLLAKALRDYLDTYHPIDPMWRVGLRPTSELTTLREALAEYEAMKEKARG